MLAYGSQFLKYSYDSTAHDELLRMETAGTYVDMSGLFIFNQVCMFLDSIIICIGSISLLKYTSLMVPEMEAIIFTIGKFVEGTVLKTMTMIILTYIMFGMLSHYILSYYQYGFFFFGYALLRSCIVFLNGFIINEQ